MTMIIFIGERSEASIHIDCYSMMEVQTIVTTLKKPRNIPMFEATDGITLEDGLKRNYSHN